jgi:MFS family permease
MRTDRGIPMSATAQPAAAPAIDERTAQGNIWRLAAAQALAGANSIVVMTTGGIVGLTLAPAAALATVPVSTFVVGTALATMPAGWIAREYGRKTAFYAGATSGFICGMLAAFAIYIGSFALFCVATFIGGFYQAVAHSFRFAATDGASPALRPKAISWVMVGGIFSGILGPQLVNTTMEMLSPYLFMASFIGQAIVALLNMAVLSGTKLPRLEQEKNDSGRPLMEIARQPLFVTAVITGIVSYGLMNLLMTSAPLAMKMCGLSLSDANLGIQWHVLGMFAPSFFTGNLIAKYGPRNIVWPDWR